MSVPEPDDESTLTRTPVATAAATASRAAADPGLAQGVKLRVVPLLHSDADACSPHRASSGGSRAHVSGFASIVISRRA